MSKLGNYTLLDNKQVNGKLMLSYGATTYLGMHTWSHSKKCCGSKKHHYIEFTQADDLGFLHKPLVYGVAHLMYGVVTSDIVKLMNFFMSISYA